MIELKIDNRPYADPDTDSQWLRYAKWEYYIKKLPDWEPPHWLLVRMSNFFPYKCQFERTIRINGVLVYFVPALCRLNPFYNAIMRYRDTKIQAISFWD